MNSFHKQVEAPKDRIPEAQAVDQIYNIEKTFSKRVVVITIAAFVLAILFNFPLEKNIITAIENQLAKNRQCPISYQKIELGYFLPKVILKEVTIPGKCFNKNGMNLSFDQILLRVSMPSFWPIGIKTKMEAYQEGAHINVFPRLAFGGNAIQIEDTVIQGPFLSSFTPFPNLLKGNIAIQGNFEMKGQTLTSGHIKIDSNDLFIPPQNLMGMSLSSLPLKKLELAGTYTKKTFHLKAFRIGDSNSPISAEFTGKIMPSLQNFNFSRLDLEGRVRFSDAFLNQVGLLRIMLNGKKQKEGFYYMRLQGTLSMPKPTFIDPT